MPCAPSWSYSYALCDFIVASVKVWGGLGRSQWRKAGMYAWLVWVSWLVFLFTAKGGQASTVEAQLWLHKRNIVKEPQKHRNAKKPAAIQRTSRGQKLQWHYSTLCPISELHYPVDSQRQLEYMYMYVSPLADAGMPTTTCTMTCTYLVPACTSPAAF